MSYTLNLEERDRIYLEDIFFYSLLMKVFLKMAISSYKKLYSIIHLIPALCRINIITENNQFVPI